MRKRKGFPAAAGIIILVLVIGGTGYMAFSALQNSNRSSGNGWQDEAGLGEGEEYMPAWVPFIVDNSPVHELEGFLFERTKVETASTREAAESGDNEGRIESRIKEKVPHYPFGQIPLIQADMLITADESVVGNDASISVTYYTKSTVAETLDFYRKTLSGFERFKEEEMDSASGKSYNISFEIQIEDKYPMDAGVMVMEMPVSTGYTCAIYISGTIRDIANKEDGLVGYREDGMPENFPSNIVPLLKISEINLAEGDSSSCYVQYFSDVTYGEAVEFYRDKLSDKTDFTENDGTEGEVWMSCKAPGWEINVRIIDAGDGSYMEINCYVE